METRFPENALCSFVFLSFSGIKSLFLNSGHLPTGWLQASYKPPYVQMHSTTVNLVAQAMA